MTLTKKKVAEQEVEIETQRRILRFLCEQRSMGQAGPRLIEFLSDEHQEYLREKP